MKTPLLFVVVLLWAATAEAHKPSDSYLKLQTHGDRIDGQWDIALRDLDYAIGLDADADGAITWGEVRSQHAAIAAYALSHLELKVNASPCPARVTEQLIDSHTDGSYAVLRFVASCPTQIRRLDLRYSLLFELDPQHRGVATVTSEGTTHDVVFSVDQPSASVAVRAAAVSRPIISFWRQGVWHVWTGAAHILFLLSLLMPAVLWRDKRRWRGVSTFPPTFKETAKIVSAFTIAHSITLSLAALGTFHLSEPLVEAAIAASVVVAALNNVYAVLGDARWMVGFAFGLLHGFGMASFLADPGLDRSQLLAALIGFNSGIETGQLLLVGTFLPLAYAARSSWFYQRLSMLIASWVVAFAAFVWMIECFFGMRPLS